MIKKAPKSFAELMKNRASAPKTKAPAYQWQELALQIIKDLDVPKEKRNSTFQICKKFSRPIVEKALNDTKELCQTGEQWKYFFKIVGKKPDGGPATKKTFVKTNPGKKDLPF